MAVSAWAEAHRTCYRNSICSMGIIQIGWLEVKEILRDSAWSTWELHKTLVHECATYCSGNRKGPESTDGLSLALRPGGGFGICPSNPLGFASQ